MARLQANISVGSILTRSRVDRASTGSRESAPAAGADGGEALRSTTVLIHGKIDAVDEAEKQNNVRGGERKESNLPSR
jgi:hypothetical protein